MARFAIVLTFALVMSQCAVSAGEFNAKLKIGDPAPTFQNLPGTDGKAYSLADFKNKDVVVIAITCNECPVASAYEDRLIALAKKYADRVAVVAINVNRGDDETLPLMKKRAAAKRFPFPYLLDETQNIGRALGASVTPEFFVLNKERKIAYMGAFDDDLDDTKVKQKYLEPALDAILKGEAPAKKETRAEGCSVTYAVVAKPAGPSPVAFNPDDVKLQVVKFADVEAEIAKRKGKIVVVDLWATWCVPCKREFPGLVELHNRFGAKGVSCISLSLDDADDKGKAKKFLLEQGATLTNYLIDDESKWKDKWNIGGIPVVLVFGADGKLAKRFDHSNPDKTFTYADVTKVVQDLLK